MTQDEEHLRLLSIFHYVVGGLAGLFALLPIFHLVFGLFFILAPEKFAGRGQPPMALFGWFFVIIAAVFITIGWAFAGAVLAAGRFLARRRHYMFCLVMGGIECIFMPFGTVLGVFTILVLVREPVKQLFAPDTTQQPPAVRPAAAGE
ncbi:MAG: hypothetical protein AB1714_30040 [Acidobacteriota bacterium]